MVIGLPIYVPGPVSTQKKKKKLSVRRVAFNWKKKMFIALYWILTTCLIIRKLDYEENEFRDEEKEEFFGIRMFTCDPYYDFIEYLHGKNERNFAGFTALGGCCCILIVEIIVFVVIHAAIMATNTEGRDYVVFWFMAYIFTEGCIIVFVIAALSISKCWAIYSSVHRKREQLRRMGYTQSDIKEEMKTTDIFVSEMDEDPKHNQPQINEKLDQIKLSRKKKKEEQIEKEKNYIPKYGGSLI